MIIQFIIVQSILKSKLFKYIIKTSTDECKNKSILYIFTKRLHLFTDA